MWKDASLWARWIHSLHLSFLGPILSPCSSCFLNSPSCSAVTMRGGSIPWMVVWGALIHIWRPEIPDGCDISCWLLWQEIFSFHISKGVLGANYRLSRQGTGHKVPTSRREGVSLEQSPEVGALVCVEVGERGGNQCQRQLRSEQ